MKRFVSWFKEDGWATVAVIAWFVLIAIVALKIN
jgi:hypothetical protein